MININDFFIKNKIEFTSYLLIILCIVSVILFSVTQTQIEYSEGIPYDASYYYQMANQVALNEGVSSNKPFLYRIGLPYLVGKFFPNNIVFGFKLINFILGLLISIILFFIYRLYSISKVCSFFLILLYILNPLSYFRFTFFYPCFTDPAALLFIVLIFFINKVEISTGKKSFYISFLSFIGVFFREIVLIAPIIIGLVQFFNNYNTANYFRKIILTTMPILVGGCGIVITHYIVRPIDADIYGFISHALAVIAINMKNPEILLLSIFTSFGPVFFLLLYSINHPKIKRLFINNKELFIYCIAIIVLSFFSGVHTDRIMFWAFPLLLIIVGVVIDNNIINLSTWKLKIMFYSPLFIAQLASFRVFSQIPNANFDALANAGVPEYIFFSPYGKNTNYGQVYASYMDPQARWVLLIQFGLLGLYLLSVIFMKNRAVK